MTSFALIPKAENRDVIQDVDALITNEDHKDFTNNYNQIADTYVPPQAACATNRVGLGNSLQSGIMNWQTLYCYAVFLVDFLRQAGAVVALAMIIYAGYKYAMGVYTGNATGGNDALKKAIIGIVVLTLALAIVRVAMYAGGLGG